MIRETAGQEEGTHPCDPCAYDRIPQSSREGYQDGAVQKQRQILSAVPVQLANCQSLPAKTEVWLLDLLLGRRSWGCCLHVVRGHRLLSNGVALWTVDHLGLSGLHDSV